MQLSDFGSGSSPVSVSRSDSLSRAGTRPVQPMPMHLPDFNGDANITPSIGQILMILLLLLLLACKESSLTITS